MKHPPLAGAVRSAAAAAFLAAFCPSVFAADGIWLGNTNSVAPLGVWSNTGNWAGGNIAGGTDALAVYDYNPISDAGTVGSALAGASIYDTSNTVGGFVFNDRDGFGSATIGFNSSGTIQTITFDTSVTVPTITTGFLLNAQSGGKKVVLNANIAGTDGLKTQGPGFIGFRSGTASTLSGAVTVAGGVLQIQNQFPNVTAVNVTGGGALDLEFGAGGSTFKFGGVSPAALPLTFGGALGSGVIVNTVAAANSTQAQTFTGVTLNEGAHRIITTSTATTQVLTYTLGSITRNGGSALDFSPAAGGTTITLSNANDASGILGGWATRSGVDWAAVSAGSPVAYAAYTTDTWASGNNTNVTLNKTLVSPTTGTLRFNNANPNLLTISGTATVEKGGIIAAQGSPGLIGGSVTSGLVSGGVADLITHVNGGVFRLNSTVVDNGATPVRLVKALTGTTILESNNSYTGGTVLGAGVLIVGSGVTGGTTGSLGAGSVILSANSTGGVGSYAPNGTLLFNRSGAYTVSNAINTAGNAGGYIGQTAFGGTLRFENAVKVGGYQQQSGTTVLDFNAATAPASQLIDGDFTSTGISISSTIHTGRMISRNGTFTILGKNGAATSQDFALTDVVGLVNYNVTAGSGGTANLNLGVLSRPNNSTDGAGGLAVNLSAGATAQTTFGTASSLIADAGVAFVTVNGTDWGAKDATNANIVSGSSLGGFYATPAGAITGGNVDVTTGDNVSGTVISSSLRFNQAVGGSVALNSGAIYQPGGILVSSNVTSATSISGAGVLRAPTGIRDLTIFQNSSQPLSISAPVANFDATNLTALVKNGSGELNLSGANTYTGRTFINEGTLRFSGSGNIGTSAARAGSIFVRSGDLILQDSASAYLGTFMSIGQRQGEFGTVTVKNSAVLDVAADFNVSDVYSKGVLNIQDNASLVLKSLFVGKGGYSEGIVNQTGGTLIAGNTPSAEWNLGGNATGDSAAKGTYNISGGTLNTGGQAFQVGRYGVGELNASGNAVITGTGFHATGRFNTGVGTVNLSGNASYTATGQNVYIVAEVGRGTVNITDNATLTAKNLSIAHNGGYGEVNQNGGIVDLTNTAAYAQGGPTVQGGIVFGTVINPTLRQPDFGGAYNLNGGTLKTFGVAKSPGTQAAAAFSFDGGTIQAKGTNATFMEGLNSATIEDGGAKVDSNGFNVTINQALLHDATLGATLDGGLAKQGTGTLTLGGTNTYTGVTSIETGTLALSATGSVSSSSVLSVKSGATLDVSALGSFSVAAGQRLEGRGTVNGVVSTAATSVIAPGLSPGTLTFNGSVDFFGAASGSTSDFLFELDTPASSDLVLLNAGATLTIGSGLLEFNDFGFTALGGFGPGVYTLFDTPNTINGTLGSVLSGTIGGYTGTLSLADADSNLILTVTPIPEPGAVALVVASFAAAGLGRRRRVA